MTEKKKKVRTVAVVTGDLTCEQERLAAFITQMGGFVNASWYDYAVELLIPGRTKVSDRNKFKRALASRPDHFTFVSERGHKDYGVLVA